MNRLRREKAIMRNNAVIMLCSFKCLYYKYRSFKWKMQGKIPIREREMPIGVSCLNSFLEVATDFLSYFIGKAIAKLGEDMLVKNGPYELVIEV